ncbi:MAG: hypothetical protein E6G94_14435 [Alphaproteobacteria bacterium]|nr:MAG: hypothetical protein E6G94_14435 [Alphaproteobacteria bacterium]
MPVYAPDNDLLTALSSYVREVHGGVVKRAADTLKLDYVMVRRFLRRGSAKPENRQRIREALSSVQWEGGKDRNIAHSLPVDFTRSILMQLLQALDAYEEADHAVDEVEA